MKGSKFSLIDGHRDLGTRGLCVATAAWPEVGERLANGALAVLPIGAASKEHGRHLPLATD